MRASLGEVDRAHVGNLRTADREHGDSVCGAEDFGATSRRLIEPDRHVHRTRREHTEHRDDLVGTLRKLHRDRITRRHTGFPERTGHRQRVGRQLAIGQLPGGLPEHRGRGRSRRRVREEAGMQQPATHRPRGGVDARPSSGLLQRNPHSGFGLPSRSPGKPWSASDRNRSPVSGYHGRRRRAHLGRRGLDCLRLRTACIRRIRRCLGELGRSATEAFDRFDVAGEHGVDHARGEGGFADVPVQQQTPADLGDLGVEQDLRALGDDPDGVAEGVGDDVGEEFAEVEGAGVHDGSQHRFAAMTPEVAQDFQARVRGVRARFVEALLERARTIGDSGRLGDVDFQQDRGGEVADDAVDLRVHRFTVEQGQIQQKAALGRPAADGFGEHRGQRHRRGDPTGVGRVEDLCFGLRESQRCRRMVRLGQMCWASGSSGAPGSSRLRRSCHQARSRARSSARALGRPAAVSCCCAAALSETWVAAPSRRCSARY